MNVSGHGRAQERTTGPENRSAMKDGVEFEQAWAVLRPRLFRLLMARGAQADVAEDVLQEAAIKLYSSWSRVDLTQPVWPFARTIALNCLIDNFRRVRAVPLAEIPDTAADVDVEDHALARARLTVVARVMGTLRPADRNTLLELVEPTMPAPTSSAAKMARMRARRRLANAMEKTASAFGSIPLGWRRVQLWVGSPGVAEMHGTASALAAAAVAITIGFSPMGATPAEPGAVAAGLDRSRVTKMYASSFSRGERPTERRQSRPGGETQRPPAVRPSSQHEPSEYDDPAAPVHVGPARADTDEGRGYKEVYVCTGEESAEKEDDQDLSVTIYDGDQEEEAPEPEGCH
ncbi:MAG TPA: sigma-70 family RNA polymerase sigma factor [Actinomycetota bacterium]|nr:sigma-70 family RNA polymerase sigma factor [Actinomycetota bacterium]